ncbi:MAG TPA: GNAT family N-acetyltransferase [Galbitalea sp.]|jgi:ribosomal protein S18 acetylase RimI-like enzyme
MTTTIRRADESDASALSILASATFELACPPQTTRAAIDAFVAEFLSPTSFAGYLADPARALFLAEDDGRAVGYTMLVLTAPKDPDVAAALTLHPSAELNKVYVAEDHHGAGVASGLVDASIAVALERGAAGLWLGVNQQNARANRFYEKSGFRQVGERKFLVGGTYESDFVRERAL